MPASVKTMASSERVTIRARLGDAPIAARRRGYGQEPHRRGDRHRGIDTEDGTSHARCFMPPPVRRRTRDAELWLAPREAYRNQEHNERR
jgi:hypothetical protein